MQVLPVVVSSMESSIGEAGESSGDEEEHREDDIDGDEDEEVLLSQEEEDGDGDSWSTAGVSSSGISSISETKRDT